MISLLTVIFGIPAIIFSFIDFTHTIPVVLEKIWVYLILKISGVRIVLEGKENITVNPVVYMSNHCSHFDVACLIHVLPRNLRFVAKKELAKVPFFGWAMVAMGHIIIDRKNLEKAISSLEKAGERIRKGISVGYFPEGTRSPDGKIQPFKKGGFMLSIKAGVPIVPISIYNSIKVLPKTTWKIKPGTIYMKVHPHVHVNGYSEENKEMLMEKVRKIIEEGVKELAEKYGK